MYTELNTLLRTKCNAIDIQYNSTPLPMYFYGDDVTDVSGAYMMVAKTFNTPQGTEIGYDSDERLSGYIAFGVMLPATDKGLDYALNNCAAQIHSAFPRGNEISGNVKLEIDSVQRGEPTRDDGYYVVNVFVNFTANYLYND